MSQSCGQSVQVSPTQGAPWQSNTLQYPLGAITMPLGAVIGIYLWAKHFLCADKLYNCEVLYLGIVSHFLNMMLFYIRAIFTHSRNHLLIFQL